PACAGRSRSRGGLRPALRMARDPAQGPRAAEGGGAGGLMRVAAPPADWIRARLDALAGEGLLRRRLSLETAQGPRIGIGGRTYLAFCSNDYLGLAADPRIAEALVQAVRAYGVGSGASHLVAGHTAAHDELERSLAAFELVVRGSVPGDEVRSAGA